MGERYIGWISRPTLSIYCSMIKHLALAYMPCSLRMVFNSWYNRLNFLMMDDMCFYIKNDHTIMELLNDSHGIQFWYQSLSFMFIWWLFVHEKPLKIALREILENSSFTRFDRSKITFDQSSETVTNLFGSIDIRLLIDRSNFLFRSIEYRSSQANCWVWFDWYSIASRLIECSFLINREAIEHWSSQADCQVWIF